MRKKATIFTEYQGAERYERKQWMEFYSSNPFRLYLEALSSSYILH
jgi:hypothetical protein